MKSLKQQHFYYGAILSALIEYNPDSSMVLLQPNNETRKIYRIQTNMSQECIIFFKHAFEKKDDSKSWLYTFSEDDKQFLKSEYEKKTPVFIYLLCGVKALKNSEIAVLKYEEFEQVANKVNFTLSIDKNYPNFNLSRSKSPKEDIHISRSRIEKTFEELIEQTINDNPEHYCPTCGTKL